MGNHSLVEAAEPDRKEEAKKLKKEFQVEPIVKQRAENESDQSPQQNKERLGHIIDFVSKARHKKAKIEGKRKIRAIRSYEAIASFEDSFIFKGRFYREG